MEKVTKKVTKKMDKMEKKVETFGSMLDAVSGSIQDTVRFEGERGNSARQDPPPRPRSCAPPLLPLTPLHPNPSCIGRARSAQEAELIKTEVRAGFSSTDAKLTEIQTDVRKATVERRAEADRMAEQANRMAEQQQMATNRIIAETRETHDEVIGLRDDTAASASASKAAQVSTRAVASRAVLPLV